MLLWLQIKVKVTLIATKLKRFIVAVITPHHNIDLQMSEHKQESTIFSRYQSAGKLCWIMVTISTVVSGSHQTIRMQNVS